MGGKMLKYAPHKIKNASANPSKKGNKIWFGVMVKDIGHF
jgi:hypothetical protein